MGSRHNLRMVIMDAIVEERKKTKKEVRYSYGMRKRRCGVCRYYTQKTINRGVCQKVKGEIHQDMWCILWKPQENST